MDFFLITGSSQGLGLALVKRALSVGHFVVGVARKKSDLEHTNLLQIEQDLGELNQISQLADRALKSVSDDRFRNFHLVNNAGTLNPIGLFPSSAPEIAASINLNLSAAIALTGMFIAKTKNFRGWKVITNLSSGVAKTPKEGLCVYSVSKAGLKSFSHGLAAEAAVAGIRLKSVSVSPGVINTEMQKRLRDESEKNFPDAQRFQKFQTDGKLLEPDEVALKILNLLSNPDSIQKIGFMIQELQ